ncbi:MAG: glycosyltransferase family 39 protein [Chitinophagales bacterium]|nr:glycosyltransferase family 39 protein [Chitinophagales bacterium]
MPARSFPFALLIALAGALFFIPFLGAVHLFDWDEINFAESAREMIASGNYAQVQINYQPFWEKPPLFIWLQVISMQLLGINEFAARLPDAITGIITLMTFYLVGRKYYSARLGWLWCLCMAGSLLPHLYFKSGIIDPVFNFFIFLGIFQLQLLTADQYRSIAYKEAILAGIFIGLGTLTKGPVALLVFILCGGAYWIVTRFRPLIKIKELLLFAFAYIITTGTWLLTDVYQNGWNFTSQFIQYQVELLTKPVAGHGGPLYYHFVVVFLGCFPMSVIALPALFSGHPKKEKTDMHRWMLILFWVVIILFSLVKTKIVHYSSLTYFPLSFLAALTLDKSWQQKQRVSKSVLLLTLVIGTIISIAFTAAPWVAQHPELIIPYINDPFAVDCLHTPVAWNGYEGMIGIVYWLLIIVAVWLLWTNQTRNGSLVLFGATALFLLVYLKAVVPKIESYSQGPAIKFYQHLKGKDVYVIPVGFKSYAHYFYFQKPPGRREESNSEQWLTEGPLDRTAYFVVKTTSLPQMQDREQLTFLYREGGFAFFKREPPVSTNPILPAGK